jgi:hypothetical protein
MIDILIALVIVIVVLWLVSWIVGYLPAPPMVRNVILVVVGLLLLFWFMQRAGLL